MTTAGRLLALFQEDYSPNFPYSPRNPKKLKGSIFRNRPVQRAEQPNHFKADQDDMGSGGFGGGPPGPPPGDFGGGGDMGGDMGALDSTNPEGNPFEDNLPPEDQEVNDQDFDDTDKLGVPNHPDLT